MRIRNRFSRTIESIPVYLELRVTRSGTPVPTIRWQRDGRDSPGATNSTLTVNPVSPVDAGLYSVVLDNIFGSVTQPVAGFWGLAHWGRQTDGSFRILAKQGLSQRLTLEVSTDLAQCSLSIRIRCGSIRFRPTQYHPDSNSSIEHKRQAGSTVCGAIRRNYVISAEGKNIFAFPGFLKKEFENMMAVIDQEIKKSASSAF